MDRDGLINKKPPAHCYVTSWEQFEFLPGAVKAIQNLNDAGYLVLIVTNQRGIARGIMSEADVRLIHQSMCDALERQGARVDAVYFCPHDIGQCHCRKPDIGMFLQAEKDFPIDRTHSWMIGDSDTDVLAGKNYGVKSIKTENLLDTVNEILDGVVDTKMEKDEL